MSATSVLKMALDLNFIKVIIGTPKKHCLERVGKCSG